MPQLHSVPSCCLTLYISLQTTLQSVALEPLPLWSSPFASITGIAHTALGSPCCVLGTGCHLFTCPDPTVALTLTLDGPPAALGLWSLLGPVTESCLATKGKLKRHFLVIPLPFRGAGLLPTHTRHFVVENMASALPLPSQGT